MRTVGDEPSRFFYLGQALVVAALLKGYVDRQVLEEPDIMERLIFLASLALLFGIAAGTPARIYQTALAVAFFALTLRWIFTG